MPKIVPALPAAANAVADASSSSITSRSSRAGSPRSDGASNAFDQALSGAHRRRREPAPVKEDSAQPTPPSSKPTKPRQRVTKRDAADADIEPAEGLRSAHRKRES